MLTQLLDSARNIRNQLTVGYALVFTAWVVVGEELKIAAQQNDLGRRILELLGDAGAAGELALYTFLAAMTGSLLWNTAIGRIVDLIQKRAGHPDWEALIEEAVEQVRGYEEYYLPDPSRRASEGIGRVFASNYRVPSNHYGAVLNARIAERERKAAEMSFRTTLAISLVPVTFALGWEGDGLWWLLLLAVPALWADVALLKHTTLRTVATYELEDLRGNRDRLTGDLGEFAAAYPDGVPEKRLQHVVDLKEQRDALDREIDQREKYLDSRVSKISSFLSGVGKNS